LTTKKGQIWDAPPAKPVLHIKLMKGFGVGLITISVAAAASAMTHNAVAVAVPTKRRVEFPERIKVLSSLQQLQSQQKATTAIAPPRTRRRR
jgi:hypothetical protein